ncbi:MAG: hypothetical protein F6J86_16450 [Symploca sp. SIO1B1]|nr:hypothetical protein [Symploca sp. SIO1B1]
MKSQDLTTATFFFIPVLVIIIFNYFLRGETSYYKYNRNYPQIYPEVQAQCRKIVGSYKYVCEKRTSNTLTYDECVCTESSRESLSPEVTE